MSEQANDATKVRARVIIELDDAGRIVMESYTNGSRLRQSLSRGDEWWAILDELRMQRKRLESAEQRKAEKATEASRKLHRKVWIDAAEKFGSGFAQATIKGEVPMGYGRYLEPEHQPKPKSAAQKVASTEELLDLLG